jgi:tungstate transport system ATP-binding protein
MSPLGSIKDRVAVALVDDAEQRGILQPGGTIVEPTSGNTGIGLAFVSASRGYTLILTMPESMSIERRKLLIHLGATLVLVLVLLAVGWRAWCRFGPVAGGADPALGWAGQPFDGYSRRFRQGQRRSWCSPDRRWQYRRPYPHHDHGDHTGNQPWQYWPCHGSRHHLAVDHLVAECGRMGAGAISAGATGMKVDKVISPTTEILPLRIRGVSYAVGKTRLLDGIDFTINAGRRLVVMGPNGAGKSLFLRLCHGLIAPTSGSIAWQAQGPRPTEQAMVLQRPVLLRRSVRANLDYPLALAGHARTLREEMVQKTLARFGLIALAERPARLLSGGEQQRLALARAWAMRPQVLFMDEPSAALDPSATRIIEDLIRQFSAEGITIVMTSHDLFQARRLAQDVAFLHRGRLIEHGPAARFFDAPQTAEARDFLGGELIW